MMRHSRAVQEYRALILPPRFLKAPPRAEAYWGPPGSGKTTLVWALAKRACEENKWPFPESVFTLSKGDEQTTWWDGYVGQKVVIFDDFYGWSSRSQLQRLVDVNPSRVGTKGGSQPFFGELFFFTSNQHPSKWWAKLGLGAMQRRLTLIKYVDYSDVAPCPVCRKHPHLEICTFEPDALAPEDASRGLSSVQGYIHAVTGEFIPRR